MTINPADAARQAQEALGARLRELRREAGLTARALGTATGQHFTRISKIEHGVQRPTEHDVREWCVACSAQDQTPDLLATLRTLESAYLEFRRQARAGMKRVLGAHTTERYERTNVFRIYEHNVIPGLFQTADYAAAMLRFWINFLRTPNDLDDAVAVRMERQRVLYRKGKRFVVVLEEQALRTWFGDAGTQAGQLDRLLTVMSLPNVSIGVVPLMAPRDGVPSAGFWIFDDQLTTLETPTASIEVTRPNEIGLYVRLFDRLQATARHGQGARDLVLRAAADLGAHEG
jgi:transcriptional regulator with XRE-family HTH domain